MLDTETSDETGEGAEAQRVLGNSAARPWRRLWVNARILWLMTRSQRRQIRAGARVLFGL